MKIIKNNLINHLVITIAFVLGGIFFIFGGLHEASALTCTWDGDQANTLVSTAGNWENANCPGKDVNDNTYIFASSSQSIIWDFSGSPSTVGDIQLNTGFSGTLHASTSNTTSTFTIGGNFAVNAGAFDSGTTTAAFATSTAATSTITLGGSNFFALSFDDSGNNAAWEVRDQLNASSTITISGGELLTYGNNIFVDGNWTNSDIFYHGTSTVSFTTSSAATSTITLGGSPFFAFTVNDSGGGAAAEVRDQFNASSTVTITGGEFLTNGNNIFVDGNWTNSDIFYHGTSTVSFTSSSATTQTITSNDLPFFGLIFNDSGGGATMTAQDQLNASSTITITGGTFQPFGNNVFLDGNWTNSDTFAAGTSTVSFTTSSAVTSTITLGGSPFYNFTLNDSGGGAAAEVRDQFNASSTVTITGGELLTYGNNIFLEGNWTNSDTFHTGTSTVTFSGANQSINGTTTFYNLTKQSTSTASSARTLTFQANTNQTISNTLTLNGFSGSLLSLRSSSSGTQWQIKPQGTNTLSYLDVQDSNNTSTTAISCTDNCHDSGNNTNWTLQVSTSDDDSSDSTTSTTSGGGGGSGLSVPTASSLTSVNYPLTLSGSQEGTLTQALGNDEEVFLTVPKSSVKESTIFQASRGALTEDKIPSEVITGANMIGNLFNITATDIDGDKVSSFSNNLTITLTIPTLPSDAGNLGVYYFVDGTNEWVLVHGAVFDLSNNTATFDVIHLTQFAVFQIAATPDIIPTESSPDRHPSGTLVKIDGNSAVYLIEDIKRRAFPHSNVYFTRYSNFDDVITIAPEDLASYQLTRNVTYAVNSLIKIQSDPKVYQVVSDDGLIQWVTTEEKATELFGINWAKLIYDVPVSFWGDYTIGEPLN